MYSLHSRQLGMHLCILELIHRERTVDIVMTYLVAEGQPGREKKKTFKYDLICNMTSLHIFSTALRGPVVTPCAILRYGSIIKFGKVMSTLMNKPNKKAAKEALPHSIPHDSVMLPCPI